MKLTNELSITGRVGTEPQQVGRGPYRFRLAHGGGGQRKDGTPWPTQWFSVTCWEGKQLAGITKGTPIQVFGKLRENSYTGKDGEQKSAVEIVAETILRHEADKPRPPITPNIHGQEISDEDIPF